MLAFITYTQSNCRDILNGKVERLAPSYLQSLARRQASYFFSPENPIKVEVDTRKDLPSVLRCYY